MKMTLLDRFGRSQDVWIHDPIDDPKLVDEQGRSVIDLTPLGFPVMRELPGKNDPKWKGITDALLMRPSPGLPTWWIANKDSKAYTVFFDIFTEAMLHLTGKLLVDVSK